MFKLTCAFGTASLIVLAMMFCVGTAEAGWYDPGTDYFDTSPWSPNAGQVEGQWTWDGTGGHLTKTGTQNWAFVDGSQSYWGGGADITIDGVACRGVWNDSYTTTKTFSMDLDIKNDADENKTKHVWISFMTYGNYTGTTGHGPDIGYSGTPEMVKSGAGTAVGGWTPRYELWVFDPQPASERFTFKWTLPPSQAGPPVVISYGGIKDVSYSTRCVPEPASLLLLSIGAVFTARRRSR